MDIMMSLFDIFLVHCEGSYQMKAQTLSVLTIVSKHCNFPQLWSHSDFIDLMKN